MSIFIIILISVLAIASGHSVFCALMGPYTVRDGSVAVVAVIDFFLGISLISLLSVILTAVGIFRYWLVLTIVAALTVSVFFLFKSNLSLPRVDLKTDLLVFAVIIAAFCLFFPSSKTIWANRDEGMYPCIASNIVNEGSLVTGESLLDRMTEEERNSFLGFSYGTRVIYPGFQVLSEQPMRIAPRFYCTFPCLLAVFLGATSLSSSFSAVTLLSVFAVSAFFLAASRLFTRKAALGAVLLLLLNVAIVYTSKLAFSEMMEMAFIFMSFYFFSMADSYRESDQGKNANALALGGLMLGEVALVRPEGLLLLLLVLFWLLMRFIVRGRIRPFGRFAIVAAFFVCAWILMGTILHLAYLRSLLSVFDFSFILALVIAFSTTVVVAAVLRKSLVKIVNNKSLARFLKTCSILLLGALLIFGMWIRPTISATSNVNTSSDILPLWSLYLTLPGILLAYVGYSYTILRKKGLGILLFLFAGIAFSVLLGYKMIIPLVNVYLSRRLVSVILPCAILMISVACLEFLPEITGKLVGDKKATAKKAVMVAGVSILLSMATFYGFKSYPAWRYDAQPRSPDKLLSLKDTIEASLDSESAVVISEPGIGAFLGAPLRSICGFHSLIIHSGLESKRTYLETYFKDLDNDKHQVFFITEERLEEDVHTCKRPLSQHWEPIESFFISSNYFQSPGMELPTRVIPYSRKYFLYRLSND